MIRYKNVIYGKTLKQYQKKYGKHSDSLLSFTEEELRKYNKVNAPEDYDYLLQGRKWWYIKGTYYEARRRVGTKGLKVALPILLSGGAAAGIIIGVLNIVKNIKPGEVVEKKYKVTYDAGEGTIEGQKIKTIEEPSKIQVAPNATRKGFTLAGWYKDQSLKEKVTFPYTISSNITLYAKWNESVFQDTINISFNDGHSPTQITDFYVKKGSTLRESGKLPTPTKEGHKFINWYYDEGCTQVVDYDKTVTANFTLYAKYEKNIFDLTFKTEGSQPSGTTFVKSEGSISYYKINPTSKLIIEPDTYLNNSGFAGWKQQNSSSNDDTYITYPFKLTKDTTLTADFVKGVDTFSVTFLDEEDTPIETKNNVIQISTPPAAPIKPGFTFLGYEDSTGNIATFPQKISKNSVFKAKYEACTYDVNLYVVKEGQNPELRETRTNCSYIERDPGFAVKDDVGDYKLVNWYDNAACEGDPVEFPLTINKASPKKYYGKYIRSTYNVQFVEEDNSLIAQINNVATVTEQDLPKISKTNNTLYWTIDDRVVDKFPIEIYRYFTEAKKTLVIKAYWISNKYTLTLNYPDSIHDKIDLNDQQTVSMSTLKQYEYPNLKKRCVGWSFTPPGEGTQPLIPDKTPLNQSRNIYAVYETKIFSAKIQYLSSKGEVISPQISKNFECGEHLVAELPKENQLVFETKKYNFIGWKLNDGSEFITKFDITDENSVFKAIYNEVYTAKVYYKCKNSSGSWGDLTYCGDIKDVSKISKSDAKDKIPYKDDYVLEDEWYKSEDGGATETKITEGDVELKNNNTIIIFKYIANLFTASFVNDDDSKVLDLSVKYNTKITKDKLPSTPTSKKGKTLFNGWVKEGEESKGVVDFTDGYTLTEKNNITFKAQYDANAKATFKINEADQDKVWFYHQDTPGTKLYTREITTTQKVTETSYTEGNYLLGFADEYKLDGWLIQNDEGLYTRASFPYIDGKARTFVANVVKATTSCGVSLDAGDGVFENGNSQIVTNVTYGTTFGTFLDSEIYKQTIKNPTKTDYDFVSWTMFDPVAQKYIPVPADYKIESNVYFSAEYTEHIDYNTPGTLNNFKTDGWATISYFAEQGYEKFKQKYASAYTEAGGSLVGQERQIKLNGENYNCVVIGEQYDNVVGSNRNTACLSFSLVDTPYYTIYNPSMYTGKSNNWTSSKAYRNLTKNGNIYNTIDSIVVNHAKTVEKYTRRGENNKEMYNNLDTSENKFFMFSGTELGMIDKDNNDYKKCLNVDASGEIIKETPSIATEPITHKNGYPYFTPFNSSRLIRYHGHRENGGTADWWWLRSPYNDRYGEGWGWDGVLGTGTNWVNKSGMLNAKDDVSEQAGAGGGSFFGDVDKCYIFGFCIGEGD